MNEDNSNKSAVVTYHGVSEAGTPNSADSQLEFTRLEAENGDFYRFQSTVVPDLVVLGYISGETGSVMIAAADVCLTNAIIHPPLARAAEDIGTEEWRRTPIKGRGGNPPSYVSPHVAIQLMRWMKDNTHNDFSQFGMGAFKSFVRSIERTCALIAEGAYPFAYRPVSGEKTWAEGYRKKDKLEAAQKKQLQTSSEAAKEAMAADAAADARKLREVMEMNGVVTTVESMAAWLTAESKHEVTPEMVSNTLAEKAGGIPKYIMPFLDAYAEFVNDISSGSDPYAEVYGGEPDDGGSIQEDGCTSPDSIAVKDMPQDASDLPEDENGLYARLGMLVAMRQRATEQAEKICGRLGIMAPWI